MKKRISWDKYFIEIVKLIAKRSTCSRLRAGALLVKNNKIIASGYNGAPKGMSHCDDIGCLIKDGHCIRTIHAEQNALIQAGENANNSILYTTNVPCPICFKLLIQANVKKIIFIEDYRNEDSKYWIKKNIIKVQKWKK